MLPSWRRRAYGRAVVEFMAWCDDNQVRSITAVQPLHVSAWIEQQTREHRHPTEAGAPIWPPGAPAWSEKPVGETTAGTGTLSGIN